MSPWWLREYVSEHLQSRKMNFSSLWHQFVVLGLQPYKHQLTAKPK